MDSNIQKPGFNYRPIVLCSLSLMIGIIAGKYLDNGWMIHAMCLLLLGAFISRLTKKGAAAAICFIAVALGLFRIDLVYRNIPTQLPNVNILTGQICEVPEYENWGWRIILKNVTAGEIISGKVRLKVYDPDKKLMPEYGQMVKAEKLEWNIPSPPRNPGGYDARSSLLAQGIYYTATADQENITVTTGAADMYGAVLALRKRIDISIEQSFDEENSALIKGMLLGDKGELDEQLYNAFTTTGLAHILAVSGLNVLFFVGVLRFLFKKTHQAVRTGVIFAFLLLYCALVGFTVSVVRSTVMALFLFSAEILERKYDSLTALSGAAFIILLANPVQLFETGFQLSFCAVLGICFFARPIQKALQKWPSWISGAVAVSISAQLGVLPVLASRFNSLQVLSVLVNLIVIPLTSIPTIFGFIAAVSGMIWGGLAFPFAMVTSVFLNIIKFITVHCASIPFASVNVPSVEGWIIAGYALICILASVFFIASKKIKKYGILSLTAVLAVGLAAGMLTRPKGLEITMLDVGQGECIHISVDGRNYLIDGGDNKNGYDNGKSVVLPYLMSKGVTTLDGVFISHPHRDHIGGLVTVLKELKVSAVYEGPVISADSIYEELGNAATETGVPVTELKLNQTVELGSGTRILVCRADTNGTESSLGLLLKKDGFSMLFTGDMETEAELGLQVSNVTVLKVAHHGSESSTAQPFLSKISPKAALISVGHNSYGQPSEEVIKRLESGGVLVLRTDRCGAITLKVVDNELYIDTMLGKD